MRCKREYYQIGYDGHDPEPASPQAVKWAKFTYPEAEWNGYNLWSDKPYEGFRYSGKKGRYYMRRDTIQKLYEARCIDLNFRMAVARREALEAKRKRDEERRAAVEAKLKRHERSVRAAATRKRNCGMTQKEMRQIEDVARETGLPPETVYEFIGEFGEAAGFAYLTQHAEELRAAAI